MEKKSNQYRLTLEATSLKEPIEPLPTTIFAFENHDNLFKIIELAKTKKIFAKEGDAVEFALGLKLFTEVVLRNKQHPLFEELQPAIGSFMKRLKTYKAD